ncbi:alpha-1,3-mannosyl-glycoprotein 4-beta-N-acetylglucosaminyltransferase-like protein MGAT4D isoform X2 [Dasypus novemcinctus]|uniref:alpha-1,3-mannosyl-glycoprotein 4-beta-N-acetylglucosaminyltransferase-like protein MGAT4D isoform X2 n=1 Tax=Dasypus novemcinctus TaxID=9361 RepID=UPI000328BE4B|nr:alpha-1,3-mannosyl-glycoprotein 4-beta-N-acetylglucosaminyltransferase-like protein MGAT4D isoform X2 [Dasypus novemcinctus]
MRSKRVNVLLGLLVCVLFSFSCFCISRMTQISNKLLNCKNRILEFKANMQHLKNRTDKNRQELIKALNKIKHEITERDILSRKLVEKKVDTLIINETVSNRFEEFKSFFPHLRKAGKIYPDIVIGKGKTGASFALGIPTISRGNYSYLKQTLTSIVSAMTLSEEKDSVVIVAISDSNEDYFNYVVNMIKKQFKKQVNSGSLEVISIPTIFHPNMLDANLSTEDSRKQSWEVKQLLDFCFLMLYAQPKAMYYLQLEDDIVAKKKYFTKITDFMHNITSNNWLFIEFSVAGFIGKLFRSEDLTEFVRFFLMFYKKKPIDNLLEDMFYMKMCNLGDSLRKCVQKKKHSRIQYSPSLFQHVGIHSSFPGREQYYKDFFY